MSTYSWCERESGIPVRDFLPNGEQYKCDCGRELYIRKAERAVARCTGCGEPHLQCMCPPALEFA